MKKFVYLCVALVAALVMASCAEKKSVDVLGGEWRVVSVGEVAVPDSVDAFLGFNIADQQVYGSTGCNLLTGTLPSEVDTATPLFATLGSTRKQCADMSVEDALLPALARVVDFAVDGATLRLLDADGITVATLYKR